MRYERIHFELRGNAMPPQLTDPPGVSFRTSDDDAEVTFLLGRVLETSVDPRDRAEVRRHGARATAAAMIEAVHSGPVYRREPGWWNIISVEQEPAGLVLPVVFTGCARDGLDEATLYHIGVVPEQRARGLGHLLLAKATDTLLAHGVWRIYCDTARENTAMIRLFERHLWRRLNPSEVEV